MKNEFGKFTEEELNGIELEMEEKKFFYSYNMIFELEISEYAKILYLCRKANEKSVSFPSYASMGKACSMSRATAIRALKELMVEGLVIKKRQGNGADSKQIYDICRTKRGFKKEKSKTDGKGAGRVQGEKMWK